MLRGVLQLSDAALLELSGLLSELQLPELLTGKLQSVVAATDLHHQLELSEQDVEQLLDQLLPPSGLRQELVAFLQQLRKH